MAAAARGRAGVCGARVAVFAIGGATALAAAGQADVAAGAGVAVVARAGGIGRKAAFLRVTALQRAGVEVAALRRGAAQAQAASATVSHGAGVAVAAGCRARQKDAAGAACTTIGGTRVVVLAGHGVGQAVAVIVCAVAKVAGAAGHARQRLWAAIRRGAAVGRVGPGGRITKLARVLAHGRVGRLAQHAVVCAAVGAGGAGRADDLGLFRAAGQQRCGAQQCDQAGLSRAAGSVPSKFRWLLSDALPACRLEQGAQLPW